VGSDLLTLSHHGRVVTQIQTPLDYRWPIVENLVVTIVVERISAAVQVPCVTRIEHAQVKLQHQLGVDHESWDGNSIGVDVGQVVDRRRRFVVWDDQSRQRWNFLNGLARPCLDVALSIVRSRGDLRFTLSLAPGGRPGRRLTNTDGLSANWTSAGSWLGSISALDIWLISLCDGPLSVSTQSAIDASFKPMLSRVDLAFVEAGSLPMDIDPVCRGAPDFESTMLLLPPSSAASGVGTSPRTSGGRSFSDRPTGGSFYQLAQVPMLA